MILRGEIEKRFVVTLGILSALCLGLFVLKLLSSGTVSYLFIPENLALAWLSLYFAWLLRRQLQTHRWKSASSLFITFLWLLFLPNSWYVLTDLIHIYPSGQITQLYDIALISSLVMCGFFLGFTSLYLVHKELLKRLSSNQSLILIELVILLSSFGIYLGRVLRWSSWDIITNPAGLILNITDRLLDPFAHVNSFSVTALFFVTISLMYLSFWNFVQPLPKSR